MNAGGRRDGDGEDLARIGEPVEVHAKNGAALAQVEMWCAAMRAAGGGDDATFYADISPLTGQRNTGPVTRLYGHPHAGISRGGPVTPPPPGRETRREDNL